MTESIVASPLGQDDSLPGNSSGRFSFDHLLFLMVVTPLYLWLELSFGVTLLDTIGAQVMDRDTASIEHWGRILSGLAVALLALPHWIARCERYRFAWPRRLLGGALVVYTCIVGTWWLQTAVIDFFVMHSQSALLHGGRMLGLFSAISLTALFWQVRSARRLGESALPRVLIVLALLAGFLRIYVSWGLIPSPEEIHARGIERQRAAYLTVARSAVEAGVYQLPGVGQAGELFSSAEGKTILALFPVFGAGLPKETAAIVADSKHILFELMLKEWASSYGAGTYAGFKEILSNLRQVVPSDTTWEHFAQRPTVRKQIAQQIGCFDCEFRHDMTRESFERELFGRTQSSKVEHLVNRLADPANFETGEDGERAARTYWVPILSLLFSMFGAFTHIFKLIIIFTEYVHRRNFQRILAADSPLAERVVATSRIATATMVFGLATLIYFCENRVTGHPRYIELRMAIWQSHPITAGIAMHWITNAQGILNPVMRKLRPEWLTFESDPLKPLNYCYSPTGNGSLP